MSAGRAKTSGGGGTVTDWFLAHAQVQDQGRFSRKGREAEDFVSSIRPVSQGYYSPLNPVFLMECGSLPELGTRSVWMAREGIIPLLWFFKCNPRPGSFKGRLLVDESASGYVPPAWRPVTGCYRIESLAPARPAPNLLLTGLMMDTYCSIDHLKTVLPAIRAHFGAKSKPKKVSIYMPIRFGGWKAESPQEFHAQFMLELARQFGTEIETLSWKQLDGFGSLANTHVVELNEKLLCADSYLTHLALSKGAQPLERSIPAKGDLIRLSPYHGVRVRNDLPRPYLLNGAGAGLSRFEEIMRSDANRKHPWPQWFGEWASGVLTGAQIPGLSGRA